MSKYIVLVVSLFSLSTHAFADDIIFLSPMNNQSVQKTLNIQISPPSDSAVTKIPVWIEEDNDMETVKWIGYLEGANKFTINVDLSKFSPGKYEVKALYGSYGKKYDGEVSFLIN